MIDLRSDTVTLPDEGMLRAMTEAELGDEVLGDDPTVIRLQEKAAEICGKEAALFVPSGSMANLVSLLSHSERGDEYILGDQAHIFRYEAGSPAAVGGLHPHLLPCREDGTLSPEDIEAALRPDESHEPRSRVICLENSHNRCGGRTFGREYLMEVRAIADRQGLLIHLDGARIFNAAAARGSSVKELSAGADSLSFCLSKGLSAPVGSLVCGGIDFIAKCHRMRKQLGGGMRQAGVLAAAGLYALEHRVERLGEDHENARLLAEGLAELPGLSVDPASVETNMVYFRLDKSREAEPFLAAMEERGVRFFMVSPRRFRLVTHFGIESKDIETALRNFAEVLA